MFSMFGKGKKLRAIAEGNAEFTKKLYHILAQQSGNICFSPVSIHLTLALIFEGVTGHTKETFAKILNVSDPESATKGYQDLMHLFNTIKGVTLLMANKMFIEETYKLKENFRTVVSKKFLSGVDLLNFKEATSASASINSWIKEKTNNKLQDVITPEDIKEDTALMLVNAIYFKGKWAERFKPENTTVSKFYVNDNETIDAQMMHIMKYFDWKWDRELKAQILVLPYENKNVSMIVILPSERNGIEELESKLADADLTKITTDMFMKEVAVALPKFKIEETIDLEKPLTELGLGEIFQVGTNLSSIVETSRKFIVSKFIQKAFIEVNEEGTEAAAATLHRRGLLCGPPRFIADHPFIVMLQFCKDDVKHILFKGRVSKPQY